MSDLLLFMTGELLGLGDQKDIAEADLFTGFLGVGQLEFDESGIHEADDACQPVGVGYCRIRQKWQGYIGGVGDPGGLDDQFVELDTFVP